MSDPDLAALESQYQLPPGILAATAHVESRGNPNAVSSAGAQGMFQLLPATAKGLGVANSFDPAQAAVGAAKLWRQNLDKSGGDIDTAAMAYHGGWDRSGWKEKTHAYPGLLASALQNGGGAAPAPTAAPANDPFLAAAGASAAPTHENDPFLAAATSATPTPHVGNSANNSGENSQRTSDNAGAGAVDRSAAVSNLPGSGANKGQIAPDNALFTLGHGVADGVTAGFLDKAGAAGNAVIPWLGQVDNKNSYSMWGGHSFGDAYNHNLGLLQGQADVDSSAHPIANTVGNIAGAILSPVNKIAAPIEGASLLANAIRMGAQGATYGGLYGAGQSRADTLGGVAKDAAVSSLIGGTIAPALGTVASKILPPLASATNDLASPVTKPLVDALRNASAKPALTIPETGIQAGQRIASMIKSGEPDSAIQEYAAQHGFGGGVNDALAYRAKNGRYTPGIVTKPDPITPAQAQDALGSRGANSGIVSNPGLTPEVAARTNELRGQGVSNDQALAQAHIEGVGGKPTTATVTRDTELQSNVNNGAAMHTPEGKAISAQNAANNQALIDTTTNTVNGYGGKVAPGEAMEGAANALATKSDAERQIVKDAYTKAAQTDGEALGPTDGLKTVVTDPMNRAAATSDAASFVNGMGKKLAILDPKGAGLSPQGLEQLRQAANEAMTPTASGALKSLVGKVKGAIDGSFDELGNAGDGYKAARALHAAWAEKYDNQNGVADLIARDPKGNFINKDSFGAKDSWLTNKNDANALQVIRTLKDNGNTAELDRIKAQVVQTAFDKATSTATDESRNAVMSGKNFRAQLDSVGQKKLDALFSPEEQSHLAMIGHAASHLNEMVPKTFNTSGTTTTLVNALAKAEDAAKRVGKSTGHGIRDAVVGAMGMGEVSQLTGHHLAMALAGAGAGLGRRLAEPALAARASAKTASDLANALRGAASPEVARAAENDNATRELARVLAKRVSGSVASRSGGVVGQYRREGNRP